MPLHWVRDQRAVHVYRVPGTPSASFFLDLADWRSGSGGQWRYWWVQHGVLMKEHGLQPPVCARPDGKGTEALIPLQPRAGTPCTACQTPGLPPP